MSQKSETPVLILALLITVGLLGGSWWWFNRVSNSGTENPSEPKIVVDSPTVVNSLISQGDKILIAEDDNSYKQRAIASIQQGDYSSAIAELETSLRNEQNDPEARIYLNNALIGSNPAYVLVVSVPISSNIKVAKELLRGAAQAQHKINQDAGIQGKPIKIVIADDGNDGEQAKLLAQTFGQDSTVLGVVGHFSSNVTLEAAKEYERAGLVLISATSTSVELSGASKYLFRVVPSDAYAGNALVKYFFQILKGKRAAIVYTSESSYSDSLRGVFKRELLSSGGEIVGESDFAAEDFHINDAIQKARDAEAEAIVLFPSSAFPRTISDAQAMIQINNGSLPILGGDSLYSSDTLKNTGQTSKGVVLAVPWHILSYPDSTFPKEADEMWRADVNWRTALAYDATLTFAEAMKIDSTREGIQQTLDSDNFSLEGASGKVKFIPSGDRDKAMQLVQIQEGNRSSYGVDFVPIP